MNISSIQNKLNELGYVPALKTDGINGPKTIAAVKWFQESANITVDGKVGPQTLSKLFPPTEELQQPLPSSKLKPISYTLFSHDSIRLRAMEIALSQVGVKELTGKNDGEAVETFLKSIGLGKGYAWCMAFVYWSYKIANETTGIENPLIKTGGVLYQYNSIDKKYKTMSPQVGSIFIMDFGGGSGHTGIVTAVNTNGTVSTIEGNTNSVGSREGNVIAKRTRNIKDIKGFLTI